MDHAPRCIQLAWARSDAQRSEWNANPSAVMPARILAAPSAARWIDPPGPR
jgi:hypothetical protein